MDRGKQSLETICLLLAYKIKYPENFFILRGNHECASINRIYGFYDECACHWCFCPSIALLIVPLLCAGKRRYNIKLWKTFTDCFNCLPIAAIIDEKIFTMHGGLSPDLMSMEQIRRVMRPTDVPDTGALPRLSLGLASCRFLDADMLCPFRSIVRPVMVRSRQRHYWVVRERPRCILHVRAGCSIEVPAEA